MDWRHYGGRDSEFFISPAHNFIAVCIYINTVHVRLTCIKNPKHNFFNTNKSNLQIDITCVLMVSIPTFHPRKLCSIFSDGGSFCIICQIFNIQPNSQDRCCKFDFGPSVLISRPFIIFRMNYFKIMWLKLFLALACGFKNTSFSSHIFMRKSRSEGKKVPLLLLIFFPAHNHFF